MSDPQNEIVVMTVFRNIFDQRDVRLGKIFGIAMIKVRDARFS